MDMLSAVASPSISTSTWVLGWTCDIYKIVIMANINGNLPIGDLAGGANQEANANGVNENAPAFEFQVNGRNADEDLDGISDVDVKAIVKFAKNEILMPLKLTSLTLAAFWSISVHGSLFIFFTFFTIFLVVSIATVRDIPGPHPAIAIRSIFQLLEIRAVQLLLMYFQLILIHFISWLALPFIYFTNFGKIREEVLGFFSGKGSYSSVHWTVYIRISNQLFWLSFIWMVTARMIANLFVMSRVPSFRLLLRYEVDALATGIGTVWMGFMIFNSVAGPLAGFTPMSVFLMISLLAWILSTHVRLTLFKSELDIPRGNDVRGLLRVLTVIMSQLLIGAILCSSLSLIVYVTILTLSIPMSTALPEKSLRTYLNSVQIQNTSPYEGKNVIELNLNLFMMITTHVLTARLLKHRWDMNKLDAILERLMPD